MFEAAELGRTIPKEKYEAELPKLRARLVQAQIALKETGSSVVVIVSGVDGAGKGELVHRLNEWLDPRGVDTHAFGTPSDEERERPFFWRFWRTLPSRGRIGIFFGSWYTDPIIRKVYGESHSDELDSALKRIGSMEQMLSEDGTVFVKLWLHLSKKAQFQRLHDLENNPHTHWRVLPTDWKHHKLYEKFEKTSERVIRITDTEHAPWNIIESTDHRHRDLTAGRLLADALESVIEGRALKRSRQASPQVVKVKPTDDGDKTILDKVDLDQDISDKKYRKRLNKYQSDWSRLVWEAHEKKISNVIVFEGWDASGKGSCIRRVTEAMDARLYRILPVAAPTEEERAHHYLWRFWRSLPRDGRVTIFDRSWYGRILVERVEGFASKEEWMRAYHELNNFEEQLVEHGIVIHKFWLHISKEEQLERFKKRELVPYKRYKITDEDWRNRKKWDTYKAAVNDMVAHTSTGPAPWTLIPGNNKRFARVQILKTLIERLEKAL
ncbi:MAG TPA: polyphosphate:AMP phosphotransferase [Verrucomicrobiae bacterium]